MLSRVKLIAEPWDPGLGGYQVGNFPPPFREWNGKFRDAVRRYWKGDENLASELGYRLSGSADLYQEERREPQASINFVTAHDGFTLHDLVTLQREAQRSQRRTKPRRRRRQPVVELRRRGRDRRPGVTALRERQTRNLLGTLFLSQGVPMLLGGDELGRTQRGNNNAYCQDNEISWVDWRLDDRRRSCSSSRGGSSAEAPPPGAAAPRFLIGRLHLGLDSRKDLAWLRPDGEEMTPEDWQRPWISSFAFVLGGDALKTLDERGERLLDDGLLALVNAHHEPITFRLPAEERDLLAARVRHGDPPRPGDRRPGRARLRGGGTRPGACCASRWRRQSRARPPPRRPERRSSARPRRRRRRAGRGDAAVLDPLGDRGGGSAEIPDLARFAVWAGRAGFSVLQLLPVNEAAGRRSQPVRRASAFALDPVYLSLDACEDFTAAGARGALGPEVGAAIGEVGRCAAASTGGAVRAAKRAGIELGFARFKAEEWAKDTMRARQLAAFIGENRGWLDDYALYTAWHDEFGKSWVDWPPGPRDRAPGRDRRGASQAPRRAPAGRVGAMAAGPPVAQGAPRRQRARASS